MVLRRVNYRMPALSQWRDEMDRLMGDVMGNVANWPQAGAAALTGTRAFPALNLWETEHELRAEAELPGVEPGDLEVSVVGNELSLRGARTIREPEGSKVHRRERGAGTFSRVVRLPIDVDANRVEATLKDGVLSIVLPKAEAARPRKIQVSSN
ncbi:MAG: Hsp20/alpha crystallin family protein [Pirellulales bacterium]|nr:Hsp20/alpha crystallin family protein [Pirellulales bacterium]